MKDNWNLSRDKEIVLEHYEVLATHFKSRENFVLTLREICNLFKDDRDRGRYLKYLVNKVIIDPNYQTYEDKKIKSSKK